MHVEPRTRVTSKGRLTIPKEVRRALGIRKDDSLFFELNDGEVRARVADDPVSFADYAGIWYGEAKGGRSVREINDLVRELRGYEG